MKINNNIIKQIKAIDNEYFKVVKLLDENTIASLSFNIKEKKHILRIESNSKNYEKIVPQEYFKEQGFIDGDLFVIIRNDHMTFYDLLNQTSKIVSIKNPIEKFKNKELNYYSHFIRLNQNNYVLTVSPGYGSAKYFILSEIKNKKLFSSTLPYIKWLTKPIEPEHTKFSPLYYNTGLFKNKPKDWLGIKDIVLSNKKIFFYTNGGRTTRTKSGKKFEISEIGIMDLDFNMIDVKKIKNGFGKFSTNGKYFIQQDFDEKRNLNIYNLYDFSFKTIRLTPTRNLGNVTKQSLFADLINEKLLIYNNSNITVSELK